MLGKLIKYDLRASLRLFVLVHALFLAACLLIRIFIIDNMDFRLSEDSIVENELVLALTVIFTLSIFFTVVVCLCTEIQIAYRFYKNLFSKEGYLTWTLPVSPIQHLWAKIISGYILYVIDIIVVFAGILIMTTGKNVTTAYSHIASEMTKAMGMSISRLALLIFVFSIISALCTVIMLYFCFTLGQLFPGHRVLCSIVIYLIITFVFQIFYVISDLLFRFSPQLSLNFAATMYRTLLLTTAISYVIMIVQYIAIHYIFKKRINLL